ncbi:MAG: response regulator, partial [Xanthomonadales bacterium]|nr:response regulator [Xanthomonadales bacterium]
MPRNPYALVVDDEADIRDLLEITLARMNVDVKCAADVAEACALLDHERFDLCLTDMRLPDGNGLEIVAHLSRVQPGLPVAVITAHGNVEAAVEALKAGAFDFVSKPVDLNVLRNLVSSALKLRPQDPGPPAEEDSRIRMLGSSEPMNEVRRTIAKLSRSQAPILVSGESGVGKELAARLIHEHGPRSDGPFVPVNCGAVPSELMESE